MNVLIGFDEGSATIELRSNRSDNGVYFRELLGEQTLGSGKLLHGQNLFVGDMLGRFLAPYDFIHVQAGTYPASNHIKASLLGKTVFFADANPYRT